MKENKVFNLIIQGESYQLDKAKVLVGTADNCDIILDAPSVSFYHSILYIGVDGSIKASDLQSQNGTYINGSRINAQPEALFEGDSLSFGKLHCEIVPAFEEIKIADQDENVQIIEDLQSDKVYVPKASSEHEVLIDDEYCDIVFDDTEFVPLFKNPLQGHRIASEDYIETDDYEASFEMLQEIDGNCIQVTTTLSGHMLEQYYYPLQDGTIYAGNKSKKGVVLIETLEGKKPTPLFKYENETITLAELEGFHANQQSANLGQNQIIVISKGPYQIFIELGKVPSQLIHISSLKRDKVFFKDTAKKFAAVIVPMLLLLLVDFEIKKVKPAKQLSIIYKKPTNANVDGQKMASSNPNDTKKDTGHKSQKQPDKKISHSKAGQKAQPKKAPKKQKVAKSAPKANSKPSPTKAKTKAYSFKMASNVSSVFSSSKSVAVTNNSASTVSTSSSVSGSLSTKVNGTSSTQVGQLGSDSAGRSVASYGSKGLSSKAGRDTAYIQTETVVLGSIDPELLRKILQQYLPQFRHCYQQELAYNSEDIKGIVDLNFEITGAGKVSKIKVRPKDSRFSKRGVNCMTKVLSIIDFPKPKGGGRVAVRQPLSFFSEKEKS